MVILTLVILTPTIHVFSLFNKFCFRFLPKSGDVIPDFFQISHPPKSRDDIHAIQIWWWYSSSSLIPSSIVNNLIPIATNFIQFQHFWFHNLQFHNWSKTILPSFSSIIFTRLQIADDMATDSIISFDLDGFSRRWEIICCRRLILYVFDNYWSILLGSIFLWLELV